MSVPTIPACSYPSTGPTPMAHTLWTCTALFPCFVSFFLRQIPLSLSLSLSLSALSQYQNLFESTRLPGLKKDSLLKSQGSRHVVVQRGNDFWE
eukprot:1149602-Rhodomonas_salina.1